MKDSILISSLCYYCCHCCCKSYLVTAKSKHPLLSYLVTVKSKHPLLSYLVTAKSKHPLLSYLVTVKSKHPLLSYLVTVKSKHPLLSYLVTVKSKHPLQCFRLLSGFTDHNSAKINQMFLLIIILDAAKYFTCNKLCTTNTNPNIQGHVNASTQC